MTTYSYNMYGEPTQAKTEVARVGGGTDTRTITASYDEAGRPETAETIFHYRNCPTEGLLQIQVKRQVGSQKKRQTQSH